MIQTSLRTFQFDTPIPSAGRTNAGRVISQLLGFEVKRDASFRGVFGVSGAAPASKVADIRVSNMPLRRPSETPGVARHWMECGYFENHMIRSVCFYYSSKAIY
jgi:hypothetical protein